MLPFVLMLLAPALVAGETYSLRGYREVTHQSQPAAGAPGVTMDTFTFGSPATAKMFLSKLFADFELSSGAAVAGAQLGAATVDAVRPAAGGMILPLLAADSSKVVVYSGADETAVQRAAAAAVIAAPLRGGAVAHPLFMDKWDRYPLGVWQRPGDYEKDTVRPTPEAFYEWHGKVGLNPQFNLDGNYSRDLSSCDNLLTWLRAYAAAYGVKWQRAEWLEHNLDLYNRNPFLSQNINPHVMTRWAYYGELRDVPGDLRDAQNASFLATYRRLAADDNQMAVLDPNGEIGPFDGGFWGASGAVHQRHFTRFLREVRKLSLDDVSRRYTGKPGAYASWEDVPLADWREFYGWTAGSVDLAGEWRVMRDDALDGFAQGWSRSEYDDSDWVRLYYPGDTALYGLQDGKTASENRPLWLRRTIRLEPRRFSGPLYLTVATLSARNAQIFVNGEYLGSAEVRVHAQVAVGQVELPPKMHSGPLAIVVRLAGQDCPNGPFFITPKKMEDFPTRDPLVNARRIDHLEYVDWSTAESVGSTLRALRAVEPDRPLKVHAYGQSAWGWKVLAKYGGYSHHTGSAATWHWAEPKQYGLSRNLQDSSETGGSMGDLRDLKGLWGNLISMGRNAFDYFYSLQCITRDPAMRAYFEQKMPDIKVMGRANVLASPLAAIRGHLNAIYLGAFASEPSWRFGVNLCRGGEMMPLLDEVRVREGNLPFRAIVDEGNPCWDAGMTEALMRFVEEGGVLVLNAVSGRHTFEEREKGGGPGLGGVTLAPAPAATGTITFKGGDPMLPGFEGQRKLWLRPEPTSVTLQPLEGTAVIGTWPDGSPAMTRRPMGKGAVYFCGGNTFPPDFLAELTKVFGQDTWATADKSGVDLLRTLRTNNGGEDLLMARGLGTPGTITWNLSFAPKRIYHPVTGRDIDAKIDGKTVTITADILDQDFTWFAAARPDAAAQFAHWFRRQTEIWSGYTREPDTATPTVKPFRTLDLNHDWNMARVESAAAAHELTAKDEREAGLAPTELVFWDTPGMKEKFQGDGKVGYYRREFTLPDGWEKDTKVQLTVRGSIHDCTRHGFSGPGELLLNGNPLWTGQKLDTWAADVTGLLKPGINRLEIIHEGKGILASFLLIRTPEPEEVVTLADGWQAVDDLQTARPVTVPLKTETSFLYTDTVIPAAWSDREVWLRVSGNCALTIINGRLRYWDTPGVPTFSTGPVYEVNITPDVRPGESNRIVVGTGAMMKGWRKGGLDVGKVELRAYPPGRWSPDGQPIRNALTAGELVQWKKLSELVRAYPLVNPPVQKKEAGFGIGDGDVQRFTLPPAILDLDCGSATVTDRGPLKLPVTVSGTVTPDREQGGRLAALRLGGTGFLSVTSPELRKRLGGRDITIAAWVKPLFSGGREGSLVNWVDWNFNWTLADVSTQLHIGGRPARPLVAESVVLRRQWQFLTFVLKGNRGRLYLNGTEIGGQDWDHALNGMDAPLRIGAVSDVRELLQAKLGSFALYEGALDAESVAKLYLQTRGGYDRPADIAFPEDDLFRLAFADGGATDAAEIPGTITLAPGMSASAAGIVFEGETSHMLISENPQVHLLHRPFSVVMDLKPSVGAAGTLMRRHHEVCLSLGKDGSLVLDTNIGRNNRCVFAKAITFGEWNRFMITYDGAEAALFKDGKLVESKPYPGHLANGRMAISVMADNTYGMGWKVAGELRELRIIPGVLNVMP